tara:strand:+ start:108 stop:806 length:699 start_codon:yes stop_codon:yes gene_type:complete
MVGNRFVIRGHHPLRNALALLIGVLLAGGAVAAAYWQGGRGSASELHELAVHVERQSERIKALELANRDLRAHLATAERNAQVDAAAASEARSRLVLNAKEVLELKRVVGFYQSVLAGDNNRNRLEIHSLRIEALEEGVYEFEVVLTRFLSAEERIKGTLGIVVSRDGEVDTGTRIAVELPFIIKHYKRLKGELRVPDDFLPTEILVQAAAKARKRVVRAERVFPWDKVTSG